MSFANEFKRARLRIVEEIAYYRSFASLQGVAEPIAALEEMRDKWKEHAARFEGRGRTPSAPFDWVEDTQARSAAKERMNKVIKAAAIAAAARVERAGPQDVGQDGAPS
jgi:hypothetical protein